MLDGNPPFDDMLGCEAGFDIFGVSHLGGLVVKGSHGGQVFSGLLFPFFSREGS